MCLYHPETLTDEEDGEGDEEEKDMWHHIEGVQEAAIVQDPRVHVVGHRVVLVPTESQGHGGAGTLPGGNVQKRKRKEEDDQTQRETERLKRRLSEHLVMFSKADFLCSPAPKFWIQRVDAGRERGRTEEAGWGQRQSQSGAAAAPALPRHSKRLSGPCW